MKALSGLDGAFLHLETPQTPMHVASLCLFEPAPAAREPFHAAVRRQIAQRLKTLPILSRRLAPMPLQFANPVWIQDDAVDLDHHVQHVTLPPPGTRAQLEDLVARLHAQLLDRERPLWRLWTIDGLDDGQVGYYFQVHHAMLDGIAGAMLAQALFETAAHPRGAHTAQAAAHPDGAAGEHPGALDLAAAALRHDAAQYIRFVRHLPDVVRTLSGLIGAPPAGTAAPSRGMAQNLSFGPHTPLNVQIDGERSFAARSLPLEALKQLARLHDAKLNDIVLALASGTLRRWLAHHGGIPRKPLIAAMPVSLRGAGNTDFTIQATMTLVSLQTHIADPVRRLHAIRDAAGAAKALTGRARGLLPTDFPSIAHPWLIHGLATLYGRSHLADAIPPIANLVVSNVPGPPEPLYTAGARMSHYWPLSIPEHGLGLNLTVMSYAGAMGFGFVGARNAVPDARELTDALADAHAELVRRSRPLRRGPARATAPARRVATAA